MTPRSTQLCGAVGLPSHLHLQPAPDHRRPAGSGMAFVRGCARGTNMITYDVRSERPQLGHIDLAEPPE